MRHGRWMAQWRDAECASMRATGEGGQCVLQTSDGCGEREGGVYGGAMMVVCGRWWLSGHLHSRPSLSTRRSLAPTTTSVCNMGSSQHSYPCRSRAYLASALFVRMQSCPIFFGREEVPRARELCIRVFGGDDFSSAPSMSNPRYFYATEKETWCINTMFWRPYLRRS